MIKSCSSLGSILLLVMVSMLFFVSTVSAAEVPARMLIVERFTTSNVNAAITSHVYKVKLGTADACNTVVTALNGKEVKLTILARDVHTYTLAYCAPEVQ